MTVSLDCRDGQHRACATSGGCCCECHDLHPQRRTLVARHALQPRGLGRLMTNPAARLNLAAGGGVLIGLVVAIAAVVIGKLLGVLA